MLPATRRSSSGYAVHACPLLPISHHPGMRALLLLGLLLTATAGEFTVLAEVRAVARLDALLALPRPPRMWFEYQVGWLEQVALAAQDARRPRVAEAAWARLVARLPSQRWARIRQAECLALLGRREAALGLLFAEVDLDDPHLVRAQTVTRALCGQVDEAYQHLARVTSGGGAEPDWQWLWRLRLAAAGSARRPGRARSCRAIDRSSRGRSG